MERRCELGYLFKADGSCLFSSGRTVVIASANGPGDLRASKQLSDRALIEVNFHRSIGGSMAMGGNSGGSSDDRRLERELRSICDVYVSTDRFPRSLISVTVQELQDDGHVLSTAINATCLALLDAGLPMRNVFAAVTVVLVENEEKNGELTIVVDPETKSIGGGEKARMVFVFESTGRTTIKSEEGRKEDDDPSMDVDDQREQSEAATMASCTMDGVITRNQLNRSREMASRTAVDIFRSYRSVVEKRFGERRAEFAEKKSATLIEKSSDYRSISID